MISPETDRHSLALQGGSRSPKGWRARLRRAGRCACVVLLVTAAPRFAMPATVADVLRVLDEQAIPYDTNKVFRAAAKSALRAVDFRAMILPVADFDRMTAGDPMARDETWESGIGYLQARFVTGSFADVLTHRLGTCSSNASAGLVLDLRGAGGAGLDAADAAAGLFVEEGEVLYTVTNGRGDTLDTRRAAACDDPKKGARLPVMLLVDGATHGTAELLAALLKGRPGVMLVGRKTLGDLGLRTAVALPGDEVAWLATRWPVIPPLSRDARPMESEDDDEDEVFTGVVPDIEVSTNERVDSVTPDEEPGMRPMSDQALRNNELIERIGEDAILRRAVDILVGLQAIGQRSAPPEDP